MLLRAFEMPSRCLLDNSTTFFLCAMKGCEEGIGDQDRNKIHVKEVPLYCNYIIKIMKDNKNTNRIKVVLAEKKLQNQWLAEKLGRDQATISKWCANACQPPLGSVDTDCTMFS